MKIYLSCFIVFIFFSCSDQKINIKNEKSGQMAPTMELRQVNTKPFLLDTDTAPKPHYIQVINDSLESRQLTFLNYYNNSIYFYNYKTEKFIKKVSFDKDGPNAVKEPMGYHIKNRDSIYIFSSQLKEVLLANSQGEILNKISLIGGKSSKRSKTASWFYTYPNYYVETVTPFIETPRGLLLTGQFDIDMNDSIINKFKFTANIDFKFDKINYTHTYPPSLYGNGTVWGGGLLTEVFPQLHPDGNKIIYSFPVSHHLYITNINSNTYEKVYAGSNFAGSISSLEKKHGRSNERILSNFVRQDIYAAVIYDKFRKVYYRFLRKAIPNAPIGTSWKEKNIAIIIMDENFKYLGETVLGIERECHWQNSFVTEEGLNIEYLDIGDIEEVNLTLKIFIPKRIKI
ncbi:DUF4221 family protein [Flavivirga rizhaonensis]|uniref:DUF4221 domain-containing protein n=1 Tax=Flavivirga rizhaonensis TaxID=2559571 RepID=A0A4S1DYQ2_9FLAO|nr:DUF4221 family protein [Flavivirga rizhaonensis]TGV03441.1 DUF4221 domain-containing protein [Flavivirga rizhaonensis]